MCQQWKSEFENHLLSGKIEQATKVKNDNINRYFYKYRCFDDKGYWIDWIKGTIFINSPNSFNDPFDCLLTIASETKKTMLVDALKTYLSERIKLSKLDRNRLELSDDPINAACTILEQHGIKFDSDLLNTSFQKIYMEQSMDQFFRDVFKVACFSEKNDSLLMWSHYTNHHQGFCIEYDFSNNHEISNLLYPVIYSEKRAILSPHHIKYNKWPASIVLCKATEWAYEHEWRYINAINPDSKHMRSEPIILSVQNTIKAVFIGADAIKHNPDPVAKLKEMMKQFNIPIYEMRFKDNEYKLVPHMIDY